MILIIVFGYPQYTYLATLTILYDIPNGVR
jgi:hypothetical protein